MAWTTRFCMPHAIAAVAVSLPLLLTGGARADESFTNVGAIGIPGGFASADIVWVDAKAGVLLMADRTNKSVDVVDLNIPGETLARQIIPGGAGTALCPLSESCAFQGLVAANNEISGPNGVVTVNHHREAWVTDAPPTANGTDIRHTFPQPAGHDSTVKVMDLRTGTVTDIIHNGGNHRADEVAVDPRDHVFVVANPADEPTPFLTFIDTRKDDDGHHHAVIKQIFFDGNKKHGNGGVKVLPDCGIEQPTWNPRDGLFYIALPSLDTDPACAAPGAVIAVNPRGDADDIKVVRVFIIPNPCTPQGTALGPDNELFLGCNQGTTAGPPPVQGRVVVLDIKTGGITPITGLAGGCDEVWFNPGDDHFLGSCNQGKATTGVLGAIDADPIMFDGNVSTQPGGTGGNIHALAADAFTNKVYVALPRSATNGNNGICAAAAAPANTTGCIGVFAPQGKDDPSVAEIEEDEDGVLHRHHN